jgi:hypothetical protein
MWQQFVHDCLQNTKMAESNLLLPTKLESALGNEQTSAIKSGGQLHTYEIKKAIHSPHTAARQVPKVSTKNATKPNQGAFNSHDRNNADPTTSITVSSEHKSSVRSKELRDY